MSLLLAFLSIAMDPSFLFGKQFACNLSGGSSVVAPQNNTGNSGVALIQKFSKRQKRNFTFLISFNDDLEKPTAIIKVNKKHDPFLLNGSYTLIFPKNDANQEGRFYLSMPYHYFFPIWYSNDTIRLTRFSPGNTSPFEGWSTIDAFCERIK